MLSRPRRRTLLAAAPNKTPYQQSAQQTDGRAGNGMAEPTGSATASPVTTAIAIAAKNPSAYRNAIRSSVAADGPWDLARHQPTV